MATCSVVLPKFAISLFTAASASAAFPVASALSAIVLDSLSTFSVVSLTKALIQIGEPAVPTLIEVYKNANEKPFVKKAVGWALVHIGEGAVSALANELKDQDAQHRWSVVITLGAIGPQVPGVVPTVRSVLEDEDERVRDVAAKVLKKTQDESSPNEQQR